MKQPVFSDVLNWMIPVLALALAAQAQTSRPPPAASVEGRVISPAGKPVAGAKVKAYDASRLFRLTPLASEPSNLDGGYPFFGSATTDANGHFHIDAPVLNQVIVAVQADGYGLALEQCASDGLDDPLTIQLAPPMTARVRVIDPSGKPVPNVHIVPSRITSTSGTYIPYIPNELAAEMVQVSDASGICAFPAMPAASRFYYEVQDEQFALAAGIVNQPRTDPQPGDVQDFQIEPAGAIAGQVIFGDTNKPAAGMVVLVGEMIGSNGRRTTTVTTDNQGKFRVAHLPRGEVQLLPRLTSPESARYAATTERVAIVPPQDTMQQQIELIPAAAKVRGNLTSTDGGPVAGVTIAVQPDRSSVFAIPQSLPRTQATTTADGSYELMLMPGQYTLAASAADRLNLFSVGQANQQIIVTGENPQRVDFQFEPGAAPPLGTVEGTVVDEQDHPIAGAAIVGVVSRPENRRGGAGPGNIRRQMAAVVHDVSDANGKFTIAVIGPFVELYARKGDAVLSQPMMIGAANQQPKLILKETSGTLMIHAQEANGQPVAGAAVRVGISYDWRNFAPVTGITQADGTFAVRPFFPDRRYAVTVSSADFANATGDFGTSRNPLQWLMNPGAGAPDVKIIDPGKTLDVTLAMLKTDSFIAGQVADPSGKPLAGVQVNVNVSRGGSHSARTDASGQFRIEGLVAGEQVSITTFIPGGSRSNQPTRVTTGTADVKLVHNPTATRGIGPRGSATGPSIGLRAGR